MPKLARKPNRNLTPQRLGPDPLPAPTPSASPSPIDSLLDSLDSTSTPTPTTKTKKRLPSAKVLLKGGMEGIHQAAQTATASNQDSPPIILSPDSISDLANASPRVQVAIAVEDTYHELELAAKKKRIALTDSDSLPDLRPDEVLLIDIRRTHVIVNEMARRFAPMLAGLPDPTKLDPDAHDYDQQLKDTFAAFTQMTVQGSRAHAFLKLMLDFQKHLAAVSKAALDADISERLATVAEAQALDLLEVIRNILNDVELDLTAEQRAKVPKVLRFHVTQFRDKLQRRKMSKV